MTIEYLTLGIYLAVLLLVGTLFSRLNRNISDFARGGAQGTWWIVGTSMFMGGISAFTFTGNASAAFTAGPSFLIIYVANCAGLVLCIWLGPWFRQTRATTWADIMRDRFNVSVEQFSAYISLLIQPIAAATQLYALAVFTSAITGFPAPGIIVILGLIVLFYSMTGGRWAVMATDFVQGIILFALTILVFFLALHKVGGLSGFIGYFHDPRFAEDFRFVKSPGQFPDDKFTWKWLVVIFVLQFQGYINLGTASRFLSVKDGNHARKAALWAAVLMVIGTIAWFVPPMIARFLYAEQVLAMGIKEPATASYAVIARDLLPNGLMGLMLAAMFAATMSSMDTGLNATAGVLVNNIIPRIRKLRQLPAMNDRTGLLLCRVFTLLLGLYIILVGLLLSFQKEIALFDAYLMISAIVGLPLSMPILLGLWIKKLNWASYYIILGAAMVPSIYFVIRSARYGESWPIQERLIWIYAFSAVGTLVSLLLWKRTSKNDQERIRLFYEKMQKPVDFEQEIGQAEDATQYKIIGGTSLGMGSLMFLFLLLPNTPTAKMLIVALGASVCAIGVILLIQWQLIRKPQQLKKHDSGA